MAPVFHDSTVVLVFWLGYFNFDIDTTDYINLTQYSKKALLEMDVLTATGTSIFDNQTDSRIKGFCEQCPNYMRQLV